MRHPLYRLALIPLLVLTACSGGAQDPAPTPFTGPAAEAGLSLRNESDQAIVYLAAGEGSLALLDIRPTLFPGEYHDRLGPAGESLPVGEIIGYDPALGVTFYIYLVDPESRQAHYRGFFVARASEIARSGGVVRFTGARL